MTLEQLRRMRLRNQRLSSSSCRTPHDVVAHFGAVQSQDVGAAAWALGVRAPGLTRQAIDHAFDAGEILRIHLLRPTWHFVSPVDIRWMVALGAPRLRAAAASYHRELGLDGRVLAKSRRTIERVLAGGHHLTRAELVARLGRAGVPIDGLRPNFLLMDAEAHAIVCSGPRRGRQFTYALLDERAPKGRALDREDAVAKLALRYFGSHGPATARDFAWWAGLAAREARSGIEANARNVANVNVGGTRFWFVPARVPAAARRPAAHLLPCFDEYFVAYQHRTLPTGGGHDAPPAAALLGYILVVDGRVAGTWRRSPGSRTWQVDIRPLRPLTVEERHAVELAVERLRTFAGLPVHARIA